jgi:hypothetical protein
MGEVIRATRFSGWWGCWEPESLNILQQRCYTSVCVCDVYKRHKRLCSIAVTKDAPVYSLCFASSLLQSAPCRTSESRRRKKKSNKNHVVGVISIGIYRVQFRRCSLATHNFTEERERGLGKGMSNGIDYVLGIG